MDLFGNRQSFHFLLCVYPRPLAVLTKLLTQPLAEISVMKQLGDSCQRVQIFGTDPAAPGKALPN